MCLHDVSELDYSGHASKKDRRSIGQGTNFGYEYHPCFLIDPSSKKTLGVVHDTLVTADGPDDTNVVDYDYDPRFNVFEGPERQRLRCNFRHQCAVHVRALAQDLPDQRLIHVADREYDDIFIFQQIMAAGNNLVIRAKTNRQVQVRPARWMPQALLKKHQESKDAWSAVLLLNLIDAIPLRPYKSVALDEKQRIIHKAKPHRHAKLHLGTCRVRLARSAMRNSKYFRNEQPVELNMIIIRETQPPKDVTPLCWLLYTSLPVDTPIQQERVGEIYEQRWRIEEYFQLIKCGYHIEQVRLDSALKTAKLLVILSLVAVALLALKDALGLPRSGPADEKNYARIRQARNDPKSEPAYRVMALILEYGGWMGRRTDSIGPLLLMRGFSRLLNVVKALREDGELLLQLADIFLPGEQKNAYN